MKKMYIKIWRIIFVLMTFAFIMETRNVVAQKLTSFQVDNSKEVSEGLILVSLNIEDMPADFTLVINNVISEGGYLNLLLRYEILPGNQIKFYLKNPPVPLSSKALLVETNAGNFKVKVNLIQVTQSSTSGSLYGIVQNGLYDNVVVLPGYNAKLYQYVPPCIPVGKSVIRETFGCFAGGNTWWPSEGVWPGGNQVSVKIYQNTSIGRAFLLNDNSWIVSAGVFFRMATESELASIGLRYKKTKNNAGVDIYIVSSIPKQLFVLEGGDWIWETRKIGSSAWTRESVKTDTIVINYPREDFYIRRGFVMNGRIVYSPELFVEVIQVDGGSISQSCHVMSGRSVMIEGSVKTYPLAFSYQWERKGRDEPTWVEILGATGQDYQTPSVTENVYYRRKLVSEKGVYYSNECYLWCNQENSIQTTTYLEPVFTGTNERRNVDIIYRDGFNRSVQEIMVNGIPSTVGIGDIITPREYGKQGRVEKEFLPYGKIGNNGNFDESSKSSSNWAVYGNEDQNYAYSTTVFDNSPLDRVIKQCGAGKNWQVNHRGITTAYLSNGTNQVKILGVNASSGALMYSGSYYPANTLLMTQVTDEDGNVTEEFRDREGNVILFVSVNAGNRLETYHVYDDRGFLRYVLSPEASAGLTMPVNTSLLSRYAYYYEYDGCGRTTLKRLPGCDPVYMVYDRRGRLVMSQDGNQRTTNTKKWNYSLYDGQSRVVETGEVVLTGTTLTHAALQLAASGNNNYVPVGTRSPVQYTIYDTYPINGEIISKAFLAAEGYSSTYSSCVPGLKTVEKTKVLEENLTNKWLITTIYYDDRCRVIQTVSDNILGHESRSDVKYDFTGKVLKKRESHGYNATQTDVQETINDYDERGRLLSAMTVLNGGTPAVIEYVYDVVGRMISQKYKTGSTCLAETLSYNTRGWLTGKESSAFKMKLRYEAPQVNSGARYNGNISEWEWQHGNSFPMLYTFTYDGVNRLTGSRHYRNTGSSWSELEANNAFVERDLRYDRNGNIQALTRTGSAAAILSYAYAGNQLTSLVKNSVAGTYSYNKNGNMVNDSRKNLNVSYNVLNLLSTVKTGATLKTKYSYLADGTKLGVFDGSGNGFYYLGSLIYVKNNSTIQLGSSLFGKGRIVANASTRVGNEIRYFLTDHLGSTRAIVDQTGAVKERNDYYPFGGRYAVSGGNVDAGSHWKYNGKEEQVTGNLGWLDYGARMYDWELGRWFMYDPMAEVGQVAFSPYHYCLNAPILHTDPDGQIAPLVIWGGIVLAKMLVGAVIDAGVQYGMGKALGKSSEDAWNDIDYVSVFGMGFISTLTAPGIGSGMRVTGVVSTVALDAMFDLKKENSETMLGIGGYEKKPWTAIGLDLTLSLVGTGSSNALLKGSKKSILKDLKPSNYAPLKQADKEMLRSVERLIYSQPYSYFLDFMSNISLGSNGLLGQSLKQKDFIMTPYLSVNQWWSDLLKIQEDCPLGIFNIR